MVFLVGEEPETEWRLLLPTKSNLSATTPGLGYRIASCMVGPDRSILTSHAVWDNAPVTITADQVLAANANSESEDTRSSKDEAIEFLRKRLADGPVAVTELDQDAHAAGLLGDEESISKSKPWRMARQTLQVKPYQEGNPKRWYWPQPPQMPLGASDAPSAQQGKRAPGHLSAPDVHPVIIDDSNLPSGMETEV